MRIILYITVLFSVMAHGIQAQLKNQPSRENLGIRDKTVFYINPSEHTPGPYTSITDIKNNPMDSSKDFYIFDPNDDYYNGKGQLHSTFPALSFSKATLEVPLPDVNLSDEVHLFVILSSSKEFKFRFMGYQINLTNNEISIKQLSCVNCTMPATWMHTQGLTNIFLRITYYNKIEQPKVKISLNNQTWTYSPREIVQDNEMEYLKLRGQHVSINKLIVFREKYGWKHIMGQFKETVKSLNKNIRYYLPTREAVKFRKFLSNLVSEQKESLREYCRSMEKYSIITAQLKFGDYCSLMNINSLGEYLMGDFCSDEEILRMNADIELMNMEPFDNSNLSLKDLFLEDTFLCEDYERQ